MKGGNVGLFAGTKPLRFIASRARVPESFGATLSPQMVRSACFARDRITALKVGWANWFENGTNPSGNVLTVSASVEYPAGVFTQLKFGGNTSGSAAPRANLWSDFANVNIPNGAQFWVRSFQGGTVGILNSYGGNNVTLGELTSWPGTDQTMGGSISTNLQGFAAAPSALVGFTDIRCPWIIGDSRQSGLDDVNNRADGATGEMPNGLVQYAYARNAISGLQASQYLSTFIPAQAELARYATDIVNAFGINDLGPGGVTAAVLEATQTQIRALFPWARYHLCTLDQSTTSTDNWTTLLGQTPFANDAQRIVYNTALRANALGFDPIFDCAAVSESSLNSGKWKVDGTSQKYTIDGTHQSPFCYALYASAGFSL